MSKLLIYENPLIIIPALAVKIGLNEAVILQQIHYWVSRSDHDIDGRKWVYNTYQDWQNQFPFWSVNSIKRSIRALERTGYLISGNWNRSKMDKTKWYTIDYEKVEQLVEVEETNLEPSAVQTELFDDSDLSQEGMSLGQAIPETTAETNLEKNIPFCEIIAYLNRKNHSTYRANSRKTQALIESRWKEGFTLDDFKKVIDLKVAEWQRNPTFQKYLRPETLFGPKFEAYLNQRPMKQTWREEDFDLND